MATPVGEVEMTRRQRAICFTLCLTSQGCAADDPPMVQWTSRDSAGVQIVENAPSLAATTLPWVVGSQPEMEIGASEGEESYQLFGITGTAQLPDGRVFVVNAGTREIRFYDPNGRFLTSSGRDGEGPGEYRFPQLIPTSQFDTIWIHDMAGRVTALSPNGSLIETLAPATRVPQPIGFLSGRVVTSQGSARAGPNTPEGIVPNDITFEAIDLRTGARDTLTEVGGISLFLSNVNGRVGFTPVPLDAAPSAAVGNDRLYVTSGDRAEILVLDAQGVVREIFRILVEPENLPNAAFEGAVERLIAEARTEDDAAELRRRYGSMTAPSTLPVFQNLLVDAEGYVWAQAYQLDPEAPPEWMIIDSSGRVLGRIATPPGVVIHQVGADFVLGTRRDESDVEYVVRYHLSRST